VLGYLLYGTLMATAGSIGTSMRESQQIAGLFSFAAALPWMINGFIIANPNMILARILSWFPLSAPMMMMPRLPYGDIPVVDVGQHRVLALTVPLVVWGGPKSRASLLMYGKRPAVRQIWRVLRISGKSRWRCCPPAIPDYLSPSGGAGGCRSQVRPAATSPGATALGERMVSDGRAAPANVCGCCCPQRKLCQKSDPAVRSSNARRRSCSAPVLEFTVVNAEVERAGRDDPIARIRAYFAGDRLSDVVHVGVALSLKQPGGADHGASSFGIR
jgi:hypothetical protein